MLAPRTGSTSAQIAAGLGVFSSQSLIDLIRRSTMRPIPTTCRKRDAWQVRQAFVGRDLDARLAAMRRIWGAVAGQLPAQARAGVLGRAATLVDAERRTRRPMRPNLIASMLAAGYDREAARWAGAVGQMDDEMPIALGDARARRARRRRGRPSVGRINAFIGRDNSEGKKRSALLVAGLAGLGRIDEEPPAG